MHGSKPTDQRRAVFIVLDSVGIGEAPDAADFDDVGSNTLGHIAEAVEGFTLPNTEALGIGNIDGFDGLPPAERPAANFGRLREVSPGKDTTTGHWELTGLHMDKPFRTFPDGFPDSIIDRFVEETGCGGVLGNKPESGTVIIEELGREHRETGHPIVYTSADPVFQIACHTDVVPLETLYEWCEIAYDIVVPEGISRVIARPFIGEWPDYERTSDRKDFACPPPDDTVLDALTNAGIDVTGVGKIGDIFNGHGITRSTKTRDNAQGIDLTLEAIDRHTGLIFTNLVDFDSKYGHRRNPEGYADCLRAWDERLPEITAALEDGDLLIITADHGNDPTYTGTDHTREYVPLLTMVKGGPAGRNLGTRETFSDVAATLADYFDVDWSTGTSFLNELIRS
jgi:phosphopentomutase